MTNPVVEIAYVQRVQIFRGGRKSIDFARLIAADLSGSIASG
ncbi:MAG TPA: hypothetical protein VFW03_22775 [Gemmatimonadaceae bacterium]|nr:hypothetical protein [Gemmatimonadaceae bacterium]